MIDFIGDIHGHREELEILLRKLGYEKMHGVYRHPESSAVFLGDYIDRGPDARGVVNIVRKMVESGTAKAILGNHEFNALCFWTKNSAGDFLREHSINKILIHTKTMESYRYAQKEFSEVLDWFLTLPLFLETPQFRAQHACFDLENIQILRRENLETLKSRENLCRIFEKENAAIRRAVDDTVKGPEVKLQDGAFYHDSEDVLRTLARIKWWIDPKNKTLRDLAFQPGVKIPPQPLSSEIQKRNFYSEKERPDFFGHYWLEGEPQLFRENICCLDYSVASFKGNGLLTAYRFSGEEKLSPQNFGWLPEIKSN